VTVTVCVLCVLCVWGFILSTVSLTVKVTVTVTDGMCVLCVLCVVVLFSVTSRGPLQNFERYAMTRHVCQVTAAFRGRRRSVSPEGDRMNKTKRFHGCAAGMASTTIYFSNILVCNTTGTRIAVGVTGVLVGPAAQGLR
jgi:hypothetical protein